MRRILFAATVALLGFASSVLAQSRAGPIPDKPIFSNDNAGRIYAFAYENADWTGSFTRIWIDNLYNDNGDYAGTSIFLLEEAAPPSIDYRYLSCTIDDRQALQISKTSADFSPMVLDMDSPNCSTGGEHAVCHYEDPENPWCTTEPWGFLGQVTVGAAVPATYQNEQGVAQTNGLMYGYHRTSSCNVRSGTGESTITLLSRFMTAGLGEYVSKDCVTRMLVK